MQRARNGPAGAPATAAALLGLSEGVCCLGRFSSHRTHVVASGRLCEPSAVLPLTLSFCPLQRADGAGVALLQERDVSEPWGAAGRRAGACAWLRDGLSTTGCPQAAEGRAQMGFWRCWLCVPPVPVDPARFPFELCLLDRWDALTPPGCTLRI